MKSDSSSLYTAFQCARKIDLFEYIQGVMMASKEDYMLQGIMNEVIKNIEEV
jgi:hypothetical protein